MRLLTCLLLAAGSGLTGLALRVLVPVTPVDDAFRAVVRVHSPQDAAQDISSQGRAPTSNMPETSAP